MFERFTHQARAVVERAVEESAATGARAIDREHLLLALAARQPGSSRRSGSGTTRCAPTSPRPAGARRGRARGDRDRPRRGAAPRRGVVRPRRAERPPARAAAVRAEGEEDARAGPARGAPARRPPHRRRARPARPAARSGRARGRAARAPRPDAGVGPRGPSWRAAATRPERRQGSAGAPAASRTIRPSRARPPERALEPLAVERRERRPREQRGEDPAARVAVGVLEPRSPGGARPRRLSRGAGARAPRRDGTRVAARGARGADGGPELHHRLVPRRRRTGREQRRRALGQRARRVAAAVPALDHALRVDIDGGALRVPGERGHRRRGVRPDAGQRRQVRGPPVRRHRARRALQRQRAAVVPEPAPGREHVARGRDGERVRIGKRARNAS